MDTVVFSSAAGAECEERAFVLTAVNIPSVIVPDGVRFLLLVEAANRASALQHLRQYETESRRPPATPVPQLHAHAWIGCVVYAAVLLAVALLIANGLWRLDAFDTGALDAGRVQSGQWWRAWTALTLHLDINHLVANLGAGIWFGYLAGRQIGGGSAWLLIVTGAAAANLLEAQFGPATHRAVGASTAVFTALGLMAAHSWRTRSQFPQRRAQRWAPLIAGAVLLGLTGSAGEGTDVVAHAAGFVVGCLLGATVALAPVARAMNRLPQWLQGLGALASIVIAWTCALMS